MVVGDGGDEEGEEFLGGRWRREGGRTGGKRDINHVGERETGENIPVINTIIGRKGL